MPLPTKLQRPTENAKKLAEHAEAIHALRKKTVNNIVEIGKRLILAQALAGRGNWLSWLKDEFGWSDQTARNYMNVARQSKVIVEDNYAAYAISSHATPTDRGEVAAKCSTRKEPGPKRQPLPRQGAPGRTTKPKVKTHVRRETFVRGEPHQQRQGGRRVPIHAETGTAPTLPRAALLRAGFVGLYPTKHGTDVAAHGRRRVSREVGTMTKRLDWRRARKFAASEVKYQHGKVLDSGTKVHHAPRDALDVRARKVERRWLPRRGLDPNLKKAK